jgi:uncharacterized protein (UPF0212 family)
MTEAKECPKCGNQMERKFFMGPYPLYGVASRVSIRN